MVDPFRNYQWLFVVIMPFGPIMLDLQGFYQSPLHIRQRAGHGRFREPVLLAATPEDIAALEQSFSSEQKTLVEVVDTPAQRLELPTRADRHYKTAD
jgi:hypothetical protein